VVVVVVVVVLEVAVAKSTTTMPRITRTKVPCLGQWPASMQK
jgi:hypothetical protein